MTMLRGTLVVHGADLERLARAAIRDSGLRLSWDREEELLAELVAVAWELSERHDEDKYQAGSLPAATGASVSASSIGSEKPKGEHAGNSQPRERSASAGRRLPGRGGAARAAATRRFRYQKPIPSGRKPASVNALRYWFHLSAVTLPWRSLFARVLVTSAGVFASKISACLFVISPWLRRAEKLLPNRCMRRKNLFIVVCDVPARRES
jgi:hypothetical protein